MRDEGMKKKDESEIVIQMRDENEIDGIAYEGIGISCNVGKDGMMKDRRMKGWKDKMM